MKKQFVQNKIKFARYGNLSSIKHKKYIKNKIQNRNPDPEEWDFETGYHSPPAKRGIYAFVYPYIEKFLLTAESFSGINSSHPKIIFPKDKNGSKFIFDLSKKGTVENEFDYYNFDQLVHQSQKECLKKQLTKENNLPKDYKLSRLNKSKNLYVLTKLTKPKIFEYKGEIWHHLENFLDSKGSIIERKGSWVKTDFLDYKKALKKALGNMNQNNRNHFKYSWDSLEVFIEKI